MHYNLFGSPRFQDALLKRPLLSENQHMLDRIYMVQRIMCLNVFLGLFRIVLPTGFVASWWVASIWWMPGDFWWCLWLVAKYLCGMRDTRTSQEGFCYLTGIIRNRSCLLSLRHWLSLWHQIHLIFATAQCWGRLNFEFGWTFPPEQVLLAHQGCWWFLSRASLAFW